MLQLQRVNSFFSLQSLSDGKDKDTLRVNPAEEVKSTGVAAEIEDYIIEDQVNHK